MNDREFDEISRFLTMVGKPTLFEYLNLAVDASTGEVEQAIKKRRSWAQGQQANPKYRGEALWVIKNVRGMRQAMTEFRQVYLDRVAARDQERGLEVLTLFIRGTLASGTLTEAGEAAIIAQGRKLGLDRDVVRERIHSLANEHDVKPPTAAPAADFQDHYQVLGVSPSAGSEEIDQAYRAKYRWARTLANTRKSREEYARLDAALRDLKDPTRRAAYDKRHRKHHPAPPSVDLDTPDAFLPPPPDELTHPSLAGEPSVHSVSMGTGGPRLVPARTDLSENTEPPGTLPPVHTEPPPRPRGRTAPPGARTVTAPPGVAPPGAGPPPLTRTAPPGTAVPRPPERITGKTLSLGAQRDGTRLELVTPGQVTVAVGRRLDSVRIQLKQVGNGTVTGRVLADRDWVTVDPARLEPGRTQHTVLARIHPDRMPRQRGSSVVTIVPSHGPRLSVTLDVEQRRSSRGLIIGLVLLLLLAIGAAAVLLPRLLAPEAPQSRTLNIKPDPSTAIVYIGDRMFGPGARAIEGADLPQGPVPLKVSLDGFETHEELVEVLPGQTVTVTPFLALSAYVPFVPAPGQEGRALQKEVVAEQLRAAQPMTQRCFQEHDAPAFLKLRAYVRFGGQVDGLEISEPSELSPAFLTCISRGLRAMTFLISEPADYYFFDATIEPLAGG